MTRLRALVLASAVALLAGCSGSPTTAPPSTTAASSTSTAPSTTSAASSTPASSASPTPSPTPTSVAPTTTPPPSAPHADPIHPDPLIGGPAQPGPVVAVKIDNTSAGFPQYGISDADIIYIEQVEGGLTRMLAVFHSVLPAEVGPVRSVRSTDVQLLQAFGAPLLVFSGGAGGPIALLRNSPVVDASGGAGYWRSSAAHAPYNLHANVQQIVAARPGKGKTQPIGFVFAGADPRVDAAPSTTTVDVTMGAGRTGFRYSAATQSYRVLHRGDPYQDASGPAIYTQNVLVQNVIDKPDGTVDSIGSPSYLSQTIGSGTFTLYRDGHALAGTWHRDSVESPTAYLDAAGNPVPFKPGKTWVMLAPQSASVTAS